MPLDTRQALREGLSDAVGFVGGALAGWQLGRWLGCDVLAPGAWDARTLLGWLILLAGCGAGKWASQQWQGRQTNRPSNPKD